MTLVLIKRARGILMIVIPRTRFGYASVSSRSVSRLMLTLTIGFYSFVARKLSSGMFSIWYRNFGCDDEYAD